MENMEKKFHTVPECAEYLNCSDKTIRKLIKKKKLKAHDIGTGSRSIYRVPVEELERFVSDTATKK